MGRSGCLAFAWAAGPTPCGRGPRHTLLPPLFPLGTLFQAAPLPCLEDGIRLESRLCYQLLNVKVPRG